MRKTFFLRQSAAGTAIAALIITSIPAAYAKPARPAAVKRVKARVAPLPVGVQRPTNEVVLSTGRGQMITLPTPITDIWTSNAEVADVYVTSSRQLYLFGKSAGEATVFATSASGQVVYSTNVRIATNANSLDQMLRLAMPDAAITATSMQGMVLLTGTVATPSDSEEAERLVKAYVGGNTQVISRLRTSTPLQVNLQVKIAEVSRSLAKSINSSLTGVDATPNGFTFGLNTGRPVGVVNGGSPATGTITPAGGGRTTISAIARLFGLNVGSAFDLAESNGLVTMLAEPTLTALSGETASFLAGGEFPIPVSQQLGSVSVEYKQFGVSLAFTPTVLADGRISMRVRPEVSQLSSDGAVTLNGFTIPAVSTRRTETTVELGSGQSFMIGGLLQNSNNNSIDKTPGIGDVPILGALFRSNSYRRNQTELMIIVTPYLVKPVSAGQIALPTDGLRTPTDLQNFLLGQDFVGGGGPRPKPTLAPPVTVPARPILGAVAEPVPAAAATRRPSSKRLTSGGAMPGFSN